MSAPFRTIFTDDRKIIKAINETIDAWQNSQRGEFKMQTQGLTSFGIFRVNALSSKEDVPQDANINSLNKP